MAAHTYDEKDDNSERTNERVVERRAADFVKKGFVVKYKSLHAIVPSTNTLIPMPCSALRSSRSPIT